MLKTPANLTYLAASSLLMFTLANAAASVVFEGRIVPPAGQSVEQYTICVEHNEGARQNPPSDFRGEQQPDAEGAFRIEVPPHSNQYWLFVQDQDGRALIGYPHLSSSRNFGTIELRDDGELMGMLHTPDNEPAANILVILERKLEARCSHYVSAGRVSSDATGAFGFDQLHPGDYRLRIESEQFTHAPAEVKVTEDINYLELQLEPAATIRGRVTLADGTPVEGITVQTRGRVTPVTTDAQGNYQISGLGPDTYRLTVRNEQYAPQNFATTSVVLEREDITAPDIVVWPFGKLRITLTPADPAIPLPDTLSIALEVETERFSRFPFEAPLQDGSALFEGLPAGDFQVLLRNEELGNARSEVTITSDQLTELAIILPEVFTLQGVVMEADGSPVVGARVFARTQSRTSDRASHISRNTATDEQGTFHFRGLPDARYQISIYEAERYEELSQLSNVAANSDDLMVMLAPLYTIPLQAVAPDGTPVADATVTAHPAGQHHMARFHSAADNKTNEDGTTTIQVRGGSSYTITLRASPWIDATHTLDLSEGRDAPESIHITMRPGLTARGHVLAPDGTPSAGVYVTAADRDAVQTDPAGAFEIPGLASGVLVIRVHEDPDAEHPMGILRMFVEDTSTEMIEASITLPVPGSVRGTLRNPQDEPQPDAMVMLNNMSDSFSGHLMPYRVSTDRNGAFSFDTVIPGNYMLVAMQVDEHRRTTSSMPNMRMIEVRAGEDIIANMPERTVAAESVSGRVTRNDEPLADGRILFVPLDEDGKLNMMALMSLMSRDPVTTDAAGRYTAIDLQSGQYLAIVSPDPGMHPLATESGQHTIPVSIEPGQKELDITIAGLTLRGTITGADGTPAAAVNVFAAPTYLDRMMQGMMNHTAETDDEGRFEIDNLAAGTLRITAVDEGRDEAGTTIIELAEDATDSFLMQLGPGQRIDGTLRSEPDGPLGHAFVMAFSEDGRMVGATGVDSDGSFELESVLPQGRYFIACLHQELVTPGQYVEAGASASLAFTLRPGGNVNVQLAGDAEQIANRTLRITDAAGNAIQRMPSAFDMGYMGEMTRTLSLSPTNEDGRTTVYGLPVGTYTIGVVDSDSESSVTVRPFADTPLELQLN